MAWEEAHRLDPNVPDVVVSLTRGHVALSTGYLQENAPDKALPHLESAYVLMPDEAAVLHEYQALRAYLTGREAVGARDWRLALEALTPLYQIDRGYLDVARLMEVAMAGQAQAAQAADNSADRAFEQARGSTPGLALRTLMQPPEFSSVPGQTNYPPVPPLVRLGNKQIVVSINNQRMYVYENGQLKWEWTASTGESARPTIPGKYRIQSKIENARSIVWELWMPYWQGLYWAGSVENGIHGQVTFDSGGRLWEGYLGTRITFGCVMISDEHAAQLYDWAEIGTPVSIQWDWDPAWVPNENGERS
jgi:lipoprotein-anchoring transpeptidase ErfK/SrfK